MDEVQFLDERPRSRPQPDSSRSRTPATHVQRSVTPYPTGLHAPIDLTGDDDEVVHLNTRTRPGGVNNDRPGITGGLGTVGLEDEDDDVGFGGMLARNPRLLQRLDQAGGIRAQQARFLQLSHDRHRHIGTDNANRRRNDNGPMIRFGMGLAMGMGMGDGGPLAVAMDYGMPAFDMGFEGANQPPPPKYEPPEPAKEGFTRSPEEDEEVVCPNCGDELAMGDTENKQHVWVIKKCGHVSYGSSYGFDANVLTSLTGILWRLCDESAEEYQEGQSPSIRALPLQELRGGWLSVECIPQIDGARLHRQLEFIDARRVYLIDWANQRGVFKRIPQA